MARQSLTEQQHKQSSQARQGSSTGGDNATSAAASAEIALVEAETSTVFRMAHAFDGGHVQEQQQPTIRAVTASNITHLKTKTCCNADWCKEYSESLHVTDGDGRESTQPPLDRQKLKTAFQVIMSTLMDSRVNTRCDATRSAGMRMDASPTANHPHSADMALFSDAVAASKRHRITSAVVTAGPQLLAAQYAEPVTA